MKISYAAICLIILFLHLSCNTRVDMASESEKLLQTDKDFAAASIQKGTPEAFHDYLAEDAVMLTATGDPINGNESIYELMSSGPEFSIQWAPQKAEVSESGDMGYTWGTFQTEKKNPDGSTSTFTGKYLNVWQIQTDGSWKVIIDIGSQREVE